MGASPIMDLAAGWWDVTWWEVVWCNVAWWDTG
jgi:hypothetical protein